MKENNHDIEEMPVQESEELDFTKQPEESEVTSESQIESTIPDEMNPVPESEVITPEDGNIQ